MLRRAGAAALAVLVLVLLVFGVRGCLGARKERAFKDYVRDVAALVKESDDQGQALFDLLRQPPARQGAVQLQSSVNGFRIESEQLVDRASGTDHPDELSTAQRYLVETFELRRDGIGAIADQLPTALADRGRAQATERIAAEMRNFDASDVIYSQRVIPNLQGPLRREGLLEQVQIPESQFLPDIDWLRPTTVADRLARIRGAGAGAPDRPAAPGTHGTGIQGVTAAGEALSDGGTATLEASDDLAFQVQVQNQGENDERDIPVTVTISGGPGAPIVLRKQLPAIESGATETVSVPVATRPPTGRQLQVEVEVAAVPGEESTDNNKQSFTITFS